MLGRNCTAAVAALTVVWALTQANSTSAAAQTFGDPKDLSEIRAIENAIASETNVDRLMPYYADDAILADITAPGWYEGRQQIRTASEQALAPFKTIKFRMDEMSIASDGQFACAAMLIHFDAARKDNSTLSMSVRQLDAFKKIDGRWRIVQQHLSVPVDQKSAAPLFDSPVSPRGPLPWLTSSALSAKVPPDQAKQEIMTWLAASEVPKRIEEMMGYYGPGDDNIIFDWWSSREVRGQKEIRDFYAPSLDGVRDLEIKIPVVHIDTDGAFGIEISQQHLKMNMQDGASNIISFRQSDCVRRVGSKWYSFFEMGSFPVDTATGKAIMTKPAAFK